MEHVDVQVAAGQQRREHEQADAGPECEVDHGADAEHPDTSVLTLSPPLLAGDRGVGDQSRRPADLGHDIVTGIDAKRAGDAFQLLAMTDVDAHGARRDALVAIDAVAAPFPTFAALVRAARFAAVLAVGDDGGILVHHRALDTRPRAHIGADLLAHECRRAL